jgi:spoIIIJ-associated protein
MSYAESDVLEQPLEDEQQEPELAQGSEIAEQIDTVDVADATAGDKGDIPVQDGEDDAGDDDDSDYSAEISDDGAATGATGSAVSSHTAPQQLSGEELDRVADAAIETLREILFYFDAADVDIDEYEGEDNELILDAVGDNLAVLIGRYGKTLDALQFLVAAIVNKKIGFRYPVVVDIEGYRNRRRQKLETMAKSAAARCIRSKSVVKLRPMTPYDRRIIHIILRNENRVFTESEGEEPNRYVLVKPC